MPITRPTNPTPAVLAILRAALPNRQLQLSEAARLAELQADRLRSLRGYADVPVALDIIDGLPHLIIEDDPDLPKRAASGVSYWDNRRRSWVIGLNPDEPRTRQRFSALHEYKHIIDHYHPGIFSTRQRSARGYDPAEFVADFFAGCVLIPKRLLKAAYFDGIQRVSDLAELFDVSKRAIEVRLDQVGLTDPVERNDNPQAIRYRLATPVGAVR